MKHRLIFKGDYEEPSAAEPQPKDEECSPQRRLSTQREERDFVKVFPCLSVLRVYLVVNSLLSCYGPTALSVTHSGQHAGRDYCLLPLAYSYTSPPTLPRRRAITISPMQMALTISASEHMGPRLPST